MTRKNVQNISFFFAVIDTSPKINNFLPLLFIHLMTILPLPHKYFVTNIEDKKLNLHTSPDYLFEIEYHNIKYALCLDWVIVKFSSFQLLYIVTITLREESLIY